MNYNNPWLVETQDANRTAAASLNLPLNMKLNFKLKLEAFL